MASKTLINWGVGFLLAAMLGCSSGTVTQSSGCPAGTSLCNGTCTSTQVDSNNCGQCGTVCSSGTTCQTGTCQCSQGSKVCNNACVSYLTDINNCGNCGIICSGTTNLCSAGVCSASCSGGLQKCGNSCADTKTDKNNCGTCGTVCSGTQSCNNGVCTATSTGTGGATSTATGTGGATSTGNGGTSNTGNGGTSTTGNGGSGQGGGATGGAQNRGGGTATGGATSTSATGGASTSVGGGSTGTRPPGYYLTSDWSVTSADWHGCVWTGIDTVASTTTTISAPSTKDFTAIANGGPYRVAGTVHNTYESVAMIGFNLNEATTGSNTQCAYDATKATAAGPPAGTIPSGATGIAVNFSMAKAPPTSFRIQIQMADGATNADHRWCATITSSGGKTFIPFTDFLTHCWNAGKTGTGTAGPGNKYANEAIDAVLFLVPGTTAQKADFDYTIIGFAPGTSAADAPGGAAACGTATGTVGSTTASKDASMQRKLISGTDCNDYIVFNNNWGQPTSTTQVVDFVGNSFTVTSSTAAGSGQGVPGSFPCFYIGANGDLAGGTYNTWAKSGLPKQISAIGTAKTSFTWSGSSGGDFNAAYDVWFAKSQPTAGSYNDAISGFLMVWLYKPGSRSPIGSVKRQATIAGQSWDVWVGPRGNTSTGTDAATRPVVSYVAKTTLNTLSFDLKDFMNDAVTNGSSDMSAGGTSQAFATSWYLTDVFAGFEMWTATTGLKETFTCTIK